MERDSTGDLIDMIMTRSMSVTDIINSSGILNNVGAGDVAEIIHAVNVLKDADDIFLQNVKDGAACAIKKR